MNKTRVELDEDARTIAAVRVFDAPRRLVFAAWKDPVNISRWWGPRGFTTTTSLMEFKPGGTWRFVMHGPDGTDYQNRVVYQEIKEPERLTYAHMGEGEHDEIQFHVTLDFVDKGGKTELSMRMVFPTADLRNYVVEKHGALEGLHDTMARLADELAKGAR